MIHQTKQLRTLSALSLTAIFTVFALQLQTQRLLAQTCATGLGASIQVSPTTAHVGDTVTVTLTSVGLNPVSDCAVTNLYGFLVKPDNSAVLSMTNVILIPGTFNTFQCTGPSGAGANGTCITTVSYNYVVAAADIGQKLVFNSP